VERGRKFSHVLPAGRPRPPIPQPQDVKFRKIVGIRSEHPIIEHPPHAVILCAIDDLNLLPPDPRSLRPGLKSVRRQRAKDTALDR
jgi:hypothetical protein